MDMDTVQTCDVCQSTNFFEENGQYWCSECNTMSQHVTAVLVDQTGPIGPEVNEDFDQSDRAMPEANNPDNMLTSFELLTKVLRGLALELIDLGVSPELYKVSKLLWLTYLKKSGIILNQHKQPVLPALLNERDIEILYGVQGVSRKKIITGSGKSPSTAKVVATVRGSDSYISKNRRQRKLMQQLMLEDEGNESTMQSLQSPFIPSSSRNSSDFETDYEKVQDIKLVKGSERFLKKKRSLFHRRDRKRPRYVTSISSTSSVDLKKMHTGAMDVLTVLWIALQFTSSSYLQMSDLFRLVTDGYLCLDNIERFVPEKYRNYMNLRYWFKTLTRRSFLVRCGTSCRVMEMTHIRTCDIRILIRRYVAELALPEDILQFTDKVCLLSRPPASHLVPLSRLVPEYDLVAMAIVLVTVKALFGLDDSTEMQLSNVAKTINRHPCAPDRKQFDWSAWSEYIECRNSVIGSVHNVTFESSYSRLVSHRLAAQSVGIKSDRKIKRPCLGGSKRLKPLLLAGLNSMCEEIRDRTGEEDLGVPIKPPLAVSADEAYLPQWTKEILAHASHRIHPNARRILERDFTRTSLDYLNPTKFTELCSRLDICCSVDEGRSPLARAYYSVPMGFFLHGILDVKCANKVMCSLSHNPRQIPEEIDSLDEMLAMDPADVFEGEKVLYDDSEVETLDGDNDVDVLESSHVDGSNAIQSSAKEQKVCGSKKRKHRRERLSVNENSEKLTLFIPWTQYWVVRHHTLLNLHGTRYKYLHKQPRSISRAIGSLCPVNFLSLLNHCASIVRSQPYHLYASMCLLEDDLLYKGSSAESQLWPRGTNDAEK